MKLNKNLILIFVTFFTLISYIKFYTAKISFNNDITVAIVKTRKVQLFKNSKLVGDGYNDFNWYSNQGYDFIYGDEKGNVHEWLYLMIITLWWMILFAFIILSSIYLLQKGVKNLDSLQRNRSKT